METSKHVVRSLAFPLSHQRATLLNLQGLRVVLTPICILSVSACHSNGSMLQPTLDPNELHFMLRQTAQGAPMMLQFICQAPIVSRVCPSHRLDSHMAMTVLVNPYTKEGVESLVQQEVGQWLGYRVFSCDVIVT